MILHAGMATGAVAGNSLRDRARAFLLRHCARYEVSPYFVVLDVRTFGVPPSRRRIQSGFDLDLYGKGSGHGSVLSFQNGELRETLNELYAACREVVAHAAQYSRIEVIPAEATLVFNVRSHFEPEALVRIRITHFRGLDQPAGASEEKALAEVIDGLKSLGVTKN